MKLNTVNSLVLVTGTATLLFSAVSSASAFTVYTDRAAWEAAIASSIPPGWNTILTDTFSNDIASAQSITLDSGIVSTNSGPITLPNSFNNNSVSGGVYNNATQAGNGTASNTITWVFPSLKTWAFGADFISVNDGGLTLTGNFDGTGDQTLSVFAEIGGGTGFLGIVGMTKFDSVVFGNNSDIVDGFGIDNASHTVPEPLTMLGAGAAFAFGGAFKRKLGQAKKKDKNA
ncbi:PEP-CTERM sorting domain-containing protein [Aphanothece sacrum]|uniref:PEP motif-containing protein n=1 Tax=Aphanothece sacrum FPU1 TaxID=1920663 RepID=A0A401IEF2_APHSA|nr:PEP-CTERM sorting domain-containing protein [Aphanothece sacrum]GBF79655.1 PEP motif-containing protein [Aphanothece sacrum FPU1]GBF87115.1 hypothetical protein AsFPU3_4196 [Aphanothece sacrum FPU3]